MGRWPFEEAEMEPSVPFGPAWISCGPFGTPVIDGGGIADNLNTVLHRLKLPKRKEVTAAIGVFLTKLSFRGVD
jgi:hypothetical protein